MDKIVKLYKKLSKTPNLIDGRIFNNSINTIWSQRNIEIGKNVIYSKTHIINDTLTNTIELLPNNITEELLSSTSASEKFRAVLQNSNRKQLLNIWTNNNLSHSVDLTALNLHGNVYTDARFKSFAWSPDETKFMYIAEKKRPKSEPFYKRKSEEDQSITKGEEYTLYENWGEQYTEKYASVIAIYDLKNDIVSILKGIPENVCPAETIWSLDGSYIIGVALETEPRKYGIIECTNRLGAIFQLNFKGYFRRISEDSKAVISPKFSPDGKYLIWLERNAGGTHHGTMRLMRLEVKDLIIDANNSIPKQCTIVDIVNSNVCITKNKPFYGLYNTSFPERCWASDNQRLLLSTIQKYSTKIYIINIVTGSITELENAELNSNLGSHQILDVFKDTLLICRKHYCLNDQCLAVKLPSEGCKNDFECIEITKKNPVEELKDITYEYLDLQHDNNDEIKNFNCIYFGPKKSNQEKQYPLIIRPHGGPHSALFNHFSLEHAILACLGFAIVFVNFRGSTGCGEESLKFLLGRGGDSDVKDCLLAIQKCCEKYSWLNPKRLALLGGSYGGFLIHHLCGQYPDMFKAVVSRNPVIDLATKSMVSDNPDWSAIESGSCFSQKGPVDNDLFLKSRQLSPLLHIHKIKAPTYLMLGTKDRRVPMSQGMELYYRLKINNVPVKVSIYDDYHVLHSVPVEMDRIINSVIWLQTYT